MNSEMHQAGQLTPLGWMTFALYMVAALLSFRAAVVSRSHQSAATGRVWNWLCAILAALGLNKQFDLQTLLIKFSRNLASNEHLFEYRLKLYVLFFLIFVLAIAALILLITFRKPGQIAKFSHQLPLAAGGCVLISAYIVIRATSIDHIDLMLGVNLERIPFLWLLEAGGLMLIIFQALRKPVPTE